MPILVEALKTYAAAVKEDVAANTQFESDRSDEDYDDEPPPHSHVPSGAAIVACSSLLQVLLASIVVRMCVISPMYCCKDVSHYSQWVSPCTKYVR